MALSDSSKEALYCYQLVNEIFPVSVPMSIKYDNQGAGYLAQNEINNTRSKHIDIRYHHLRDLIQLGLFKLDYVSTTINTADIFTKSLPRPAFQLHEPYVLGHVSTLRG
jgi:hypothetical protein